MTKRFVTERNYHVYGIFLYSLYYFTIRETQPSANLFSFSPIQQKKEPWTWSLIIGEINLLLWKYIQTSSQASLMTL